MALAARIQGVVGLEMVIDEEGRVADAKVVRSVPPLDRAAVDAVLQWRFTPTMFSGAPARVVVSGEVLFTLEN
jgi:protein TonB